MLKQSAQRNYSGQQATEIRPPILLFSSVLIGVLLVLWITASFSGEAADNLAADTKNTHSAHHAPDGQSAPAHCIFPGNNQRSC